MVSVNQRKPQIFEDSLYVTHKLVQGRPSPRSYRDGDVSLTYEKAD